jgi:signal transduction histidine kinase
VTPRANRLVAWGLAALSFALLAATAALSMIRSGEPADLSGIVIVAAFASFAAVGAVIVSNQPGNTVGRLFLLMSVSSGFAFLADSWVRAEPPLPARGATAVVASIAFTGAFIPMMLVLLVFPDGRLLSSRWRPAVWLAIAALVTIPLGQALSPTLVDYAGLENPIGIDWVDGSPLEDGGIGWGFALVGFVVAAAAVVVRYRRSVGEDRQRLKWLAVAAAFVAVGWVCQSIGFDMAGTAGSLLRLSLSLAILVFPLAVGAAVLRRGLYEIDVVINKALVYGALAAFITVVYIAIVVGIGSVVGSADEPNLGLQIASTAVVAVAFQPVRERVRRLANRLVYGRRATPYEVMAGFSRSVAGTLSVHDVLREMAQAAGSGIGARRARVRLFLPNGDRVVTWPDDGHTETGQVLAIPVGYRGEPIGEIAVEKPPGEPITPAERALLDDLASQAGLAMHNVRLTEDLAARADLVADQSEQLRRSRERLVTARDVQRRRLERDIREGPQQRLLAIGGRLKEATGAVERDPQKVTEILDDLTGQANSTLEGLRDLARGIFPPLLADRGIVPALRAHVRKVGADTTIDAPLGFDDERFDPDTEATVYFCCLQAIQNVLRHAGNARTIVRLDRDADGAIVFSVRDEGPGFDVDRVPRGMGFDIMQDRVDALGGELEVVSSPGAGTTVTGRVPSRAIEAVPS